MNVTTPCMTCGGQGVVAIAGPDENGQYDTDDCPECSKATCTCSPCRSPQYGVPGVDHCAACCAGTLVEDYDHDCPIVEHRRMAERQYGTRTPTVHTFVGDNSDRHARKLAGPGAI